MAFLSLLLCIFNCLTWSNALSLTSGTQHKLTSRSRFRSESLSSKYTNERYGRSDSHYLSTSEVNTIETVSSSNVISAHHSSSILLPGGGIFFYWQIGVMQYLRDEGYDLSNTKFAGASAGALAATLTVCNVDFTEATDLALKLAEGAQVWEKGTLQGIWGELIENWLDELLPHNAAEIASEKLSLLVTPVPSFRKSRITKFVDKEDLIRCNMASVHLPWFLNGKLTTDFRAKPHIDGSFLAKPENYFDNYEHAVTLDWQNDPIMSSKANDFVKLTSKRGIWSMVQRGKVFAKIMEGRGIFANLQKLS